MLASKEEIDFNSTIKKSFEHESNPSFQQSENKRSFASGNADRKFKFAEPQVQPDSDEQEEEEIHEQTIQKEEELEERGVFLTMD